MKVKIGLETHVQLNTLTKAFCGCRNPASSGTDVLQERGAWVRDYLQKRNARFDFVEHESVTRPVNSARARGVHVRQIAKALVYVCDNDPVLFILSGDRRLDKRKAMAATACKAIRMATPDEVRKFTNCVVGLVPPTIDGIRKVIDTRLLENDILSFNAGISTAGIKIDRRELLKVLDRTERAGISSDEVIVEKPTKETHKPAPTAEAEPNTMVCDTCLGLPGTKPRINAAMVDKAIRVALALDCRISPSTFFSRKTYFYPDMSKNFQITQYEVPLAENGHVNIREFVVGKSKAGGPDVAGGKKIRITRVHMEEDPSRIVHVGGLGGKHTLLDYNRAGIPLIEIVTEPDFSSPEEAREFLQKLTTIMEYLGVYDSGSRAVLKSDANISLSGGKRVEVKNITGTKEIEQALKFEIFRQQNLLKRGGKVVQSTRTWDPVTRTTRELRAKETEEDYGYIFEPDLPVLDVTREQVNRIRKALPELPDQKHSRFVRQYKINPKVAEALVSELDLAELFEQSSRKVDPRLASVWIAGYLKKTLNYNDLRFRDSGLKPEWIIRWLKDIENGEFTDRNAELLIRRMVEDRADPDTVRKKHGIGKRLKKVLTEDIRIQESVQAVLEKNPKAVRDYESGEEKALHFLVGLAMRETRGQVDANDIMKLLLKLIKK